MDPQAWGGPGWKFYHDVSLGYPEHPTDEDKRHYYAFYMNMQHILPCVVCRENEAAHIKYKPLTLDDLKDRTSLINWCIDHHNTVNQQLGKRIIPRHEAYDLITSKKSKPCGLYISGGITVIALVILMIYLIRRQKN